MSNNVEVALTADSTGNPWSVMVWDLNSGTKLMNYNGAVCTSRTVSLIGNDYFVGAVVNKPLLQIWALHSRDQQQVRMVCPGRVSALAVSPNGAYLVAGIEEKLHVWQVCSGELMTVIGRHYQTVSCIVFTSDNCYFISGGDDGQVLVWSLSRVLSPNAHVMGRSLSNAEAVHTWHHHVLPVRDVAVGCGGSGSRVVTCSLDQTCRLYDRLSGQLLLTVHVDVGLTSVALDPAEYHIFMGAANGSIYTVQLFNPLKTLNVHLDSENDGDKTFVGHSGAVTCLSVSMDGLTLLSGSDDHNCRVWNIPSRQCNRVIPHKGAVTCARFVPAYHNMFSLDNVKPRLTISPLKRHLRGAAEDEGDGGFSVNVNCRFNSQLQTGSLLKLQNSSTDSTVHDVRETLAKVTEHVCDAVSKVENMTAVNKQLYQYSVDHVLNGID